MKRTTRYTVWISVCVMLLGAAVTVGVLWYLQRPPFPAEWADVRAGMTRNQVITMIGSPPLVDLRRIKGYDVCMHRCGASETWQLLIYYDCGGDDLETVQSVTFRFTDHEFGPRNLLAIDPDEEFRSRYGQ